MNILIEFPGIIPALKYGGTERVIWCLGKSLVDLGHKVSYLVHEGSHCNFAKIICRDENVSINNQIPENTDIVHFNSLVECEIKKPFIVTVHGNLNDDREINQNTVFVSSDHAKRFGSNSFVYNGLDWGEYADPNLESKRKYFHFLGKGAWRLKNLSGAIKIINQSKEERLRVLGATRINFKMGFRFTLSSRVRFYGMVGDEIKNKHLQESKGLIFPVLWHEPFGLAIIESLYFGCPVFGTPYGSLPELVSKDVGFLSNSVSELVEAIAHSESFSKNRCHEYAKEEFNSRKMALAYIMKYEKVLNGEKLNPTSLKLEWKQEDKFLPWIG